MSLGLLVVAVLLPFAAAALSLYLGPARVLTAVRASLAASIVLTAAVSLVAQGTELPLLAGRSLVFGPLAQLGTQILGMAMLGLILALEDESPVLVSSWLGTAWASIGGLVVALLVSALPLALLAFLGAAMVWAVQLPGATRPRSRAVMRYAVLLAFLAPILLGALRLAEGRTSTALESERVVLALAVPGFGLVLGLFPLHAWVLTLAGGLPRPTLFGVLVLVQTAGFMMLLRTLAVYPWLLGSAQAAFIFGGTLSALVGGWLALSARLDDPDDFLVYAVVANGGILLAGLGTRHADASAGVALLLFARVVALVLIALAPRAGAGLRRWAYAVGILTLAGLPGLAGFPGLWLILSRLPQSWPSALPPLGIVAGSFMLFATALRRWHAPEVPADPVGAPGARRAVLMLCAFLVLIGLAPRIMPAAFYTALQDSIFLLR